MSKQTASEPASTPKKASGASSGLAIFLAVVFVLFAVVGLIGFNIWSVLFNPPLVKQALTTEIVSSNLAPSLLELFSEWRAGQRVANNESLSGVNEPDIVLLISYLDAEDWSQIRQLLVTDEFITHLVSVSVDGFYGWLDSTEPLPNIAWDMALLKERMTGQEGTEAIMVAYAALPVCTEAEIADLQLRLSKMPPGVSVLYNLCQFPDPWHEDQVNDYIDALNGINENVPARFNVSELLGGSPSGGAEGAALIKSQLRLVRVIAQWFWVVALVLLLVIAGIRVRSRRSLGLFIGIPFTITGVLAILIAWVGQVFILQLVTRSLLAATSDLVRQDIANSLKHLTGIFFQPLLIQGIILLGLGIVLIALIFIKGKGSQKPPVAS